MKKYFFIISLLAASLVPAAHAKDPVKVFILAGQSNMQGHGRIAMGKEMNAAIRAEEERKMKRLAAEREREKVEAAAARAKIREKLLADRCASGSE